MTKTEEGCLSLMVSILVMLAKAFMLYFGMQLLGFYGFSFGNALGVIILSEIVIFSIKQTR